MWCAARPYFGTPFFFIIPIFELYYNALMFSNINWKQMLQTVFSCGCIIRFNASGSLLQPPKKLQLQASTQSVNTKTKSCSVNINHILHVKWTLRGKATWIHATPLRSFTVTEVDRTISPNTIKQDLHSHSATSYLIFCLLSANEGRLNALLTQLCQYN